MSNCTTVCLAGLVFARGLEASGKEHSVMAR